MTNPKPEESARVFFALWPQAAERAALAAWQAPLEKLCGGKTMRPENLHATLVFLGTVAQRRLEALQLAGQEVSGTQFELRFNAARYWGHNHIVYAAPGRTPEPLELLVQALELNLRRHRFHFDQREYKPHITLLRHARWNDTPLPDMPAVSWRMRDFALVQSASNAQGPRYEVLARFPLAKS